MIQIPLRERHERFSITLPETVAERIHAIAIKLQVPVSQVIAALLAKALKGEKI